MAKEDLTDAGISLMIGAFIVVTIYNALNWSVIAAVATLMAVVPVIFIALHIKGMNKKTK